MQDPTIEQYQQLQTLQNSDSLTNPLGDLQTQIFDQLATFLLFGVIASIAIFVPLIIIYTLSAIRKHKTYKAILDIQKTLHEMNERDKARTPKAISSVPEPAPRVNPSRLVQ